METFSFDRLQKELTDTNVKNPRISFGFQVVRITSLPFFWDVLDQLMLIIVAIAILIQSDFAFLAIPIFAASFYLLYINFIGCGKCVIDFTDYSLVIKNHIFLFNLFRKAFGNKQRIEFKEVKEISYQEGPRLRGAAYRNRYQLLLETYKDAPVIVTQFDNEKDAQKLSSILRRAILHKER